MVVVAVVVVMVAVAVVVVHVMVVGHKRGFTHTTNNDGTGLLRERERSCVYTIQIKLTLVW